MSADISIVLTVSGGDEVSLLKAGVVTFYFLKISLQRG